MERFTHEEIGRQIAQFAGLGVITEESLLRICLIISRLSQAGLDEETFVNDIAKLYPQWAGLIVQTLLVIQRSPRLALRKPVQIEDEEE